MGDRLLRPSRCPGEVWALVRSCWQSDPPRPQEIMRDMNHMLHRGMTNRFISTENLYMHNIMQKIICTEHMSSVLFV